MGGLLRATMFGWLCVVASASAAGLQQAEERFQADRLSEAEALYRQALPGASPFERRVCYDRLLSIYSRLDRSDQAVMLGTKYLAWLKELGDADRAREVSVEVAAHYHALRHYREAQATLASATADGKLSEPLKLRAAEVLAQTAEAQRDPATAERWKAVETQATRMLTDVKYTAVERQRINTVWKLADARSGQGNHAAAAADLEALLNTINETEREDRRETYRKLAERRLALKKYPEAETALRGALAAHAAIKGDPYTLGRLLSDLGDTLRSQGKPLEAETVELKAAEAFSECLRHPERLSRGAGGGSVNAFWSLQRLYDKSNQYRQALQLTQNQSELWATSDLLKQRLQARRGMLEIVLGAYGDARDRLRTVVAALEAEQPVNLMELPRAYNNLAAVEIAAQELDKAEILCKKCVALYETHGLPDDLLKLETYNLAGSVYAQKGQYSQAIERFRQGARICEPIGKDADPQLSTILLNIALIHKIQGEIPSALEMCEQAEKVYRRFAIANDLGSAAFAAARAEMYAGQGQFPRAAALAPEILRLCQESGITNGPLVVTARHSLALAELNERHYDAAVAIWTELRTMQEKDGFTQLLPRTVNYLARVAELRGDDKTAIRFYEEAQRMGKNNGRTMPVTEFITCWRLAILYDKQGKHAEADALLDESIAVVEKTRLNAFGDAQQRSSFFAQFEPAFEQRVNWYVRDGKIEDAIAAVSRSRSRALLDQLQMANVDPKQGLTGPNAGKLLAKEHELKDRISSIRSRAQFVPLDSLNVDQAKKINAEYEAAQKEYAEVWREILNASPVYRNLAGIDFSTDALRKTRARLASQKAMLLVYHLGKEGGYLLVAGDPSEPAKSYPLTITADLAQKMVAPPSPVFVASLRGSRGFEFADANEPKDAPPAPPVKPAGPQVSLKQRAARILVEQYLPHLSSPRFQPTRGFEFASSDETAPAPTQRFDLLGNVFLPLAARKQIQAANPERLVVIPDGALHKLPLEAMLLATEPDLRYVLDEMPPMAYAPSVAFLQFMADRPAPVGTNRGSLLTLGNPAYPQAAPLPKGTGRNEPRSLLELVSRIPPLEGTATEQKFIRQFFPADKVTMLEGKDATEGNFTKAVAGKQFVHLAAHGMANDCWGNLFGALLLAPPPPGTARPEDDGFLHLHEIYTLPLQECELAVLSACVTNVGPQRPLEAGITLASGFLSAGARRVVASHWKVDDDSTAALMTAFFSEVTQAENAGKKVSYTTALQNARKKVRSQPQWQSPFYWAPFVIVGNSD